MGNNAEFISYNCVLFSYSQVRRGAGALFPCSFKREATGTEVTFNNSIVSDFMVNTIYLKQIHCSYSRAHNIQNGFLHFLLLLLRSTLLLNRNKHIDGRIFCFL